MMCGSTECGVGHGRHIIFKDGVRCRVHIFKFFFTTVLCIFTMMGLAGCTKTNKYRQEIPHNVPNDSIEYVKARDFAGVVKKVDEKKNSITFYDPSSESDVSFIYTPATATLTKNEKDIIITSLQPGDVVDVFLDDNKSEIEKIKESSDIIIREDAEGIVVDDDEKFIEIDGVKYKYGSGFKAFSYGKPVDVTEITAWDRVLFRGVEGKAYSLVVTRGHGYIKPKRHGDFLGGTVTVDGVCILPVTEDMMIPAPEGDYVVYMQNGDYEGKKGVYVKRDGVTIADMSDVKKLVENTSHVTFKIQPEGAVLYIDGVEKDNKEPVSMKYGKHNVKVELEGYTDYTGIIDVKSAGPVIKINLAEEEAAVDDEGELEPISTPKADIYDPDGEITVSAPEGVSVYMDGSYEGMAPCTFKKKVGHVTITLSDSDSNTKSYNITTLMDGEDVSFSFPELK